MNRALVHLIPTFCGLTLCASEPNRTGGQNVFRTSVHEVAVFPAVFDSAGRLVPGLTRADFVVLDNGRQAEIRTFSNDAVPVTVALLIDTSGSMANKLIRVRSAALHLIDALKQGDRVRIGSFGSEVAINPWLTNDKDVLRRILEEELWIGESTRLWAGLHAAASSLRSEPGRRVLLIITDGKATDGGVRDQVYDELLRNQFMVYSIGLEGNGLTHDLVNLAADTGGGHFELKDSQDLDSTFARVLDELRQQYVIGFVPRALDGLRHSLKVKTTNQSFTTKAPAVYVASKG